MDVHMTARQFKAHRTLRDHALASIKRLDKFYDGIVRSDIILSYERKRQSIKVAEIILHVDKSVLSSREKSEDFTKSIDLAIVKLERQLAKHKSKLRQKDKLALRRMKQEVVAAGVGEEE